MPKAADSVTPSHADSAESQTPGKSLLFYAVIALAVVYCGSLIGLALLTSNPVVLNPYQIRNSSLIVSGSLESSQTEGATLRIEKIWKGSAGTETVFVRHLTAADLRGHDVWIVPLKQNSSTAYEVTPLKNASSAGSAQLLYPADLDTVNKLKSLLSPDDSSL